MANFIENIKNRLKNKDVLSWLMIINLVLFFILGILNFISFIFKIVNVNFLDYFGLSSDISIFETHPWTIFTYMFAHTQPLHFLLNIFFLSWFGKLFLNFFSGKNLGSLYILGGLSGAILYMICFNAIPYYIEMGHTMLIGASASVMAIIFAVAFYKSDLTLNLIFIGQVKIIYIALFIFLIDFISLGDVSNPGGHVAHIGGAIVGYIFAKQYLKGKDITKWMSQVIDFIVNLRKPKPRKKMKVTYSKRANDYDYNQRRNMQSLEIDRILDKIKSSGYSSLSSDEKKQLFDASKK